MKQLIIGSTALKYWFPKDYPREPKDFDIAVESFDGLKEDPDVEYLVNPVILKYQPLGYINPAYLLTLKMSHLFWDINWKKHMYDVQFLLDKGYRYDENILNELIEYWEETKPKIRRSNLSMSAKDFFDNAVNKDDQEHDALHALLNPVPMYTKILKDGCEVELDEEKWKNLSFEEKCDVVFEETAVMAYERFPDKNYSIGYKKQLKANIIRHFPKYIAIFAIVNYKKVLKPKFNFEKTIKDGQEKIQRTV